MHKKSFLMGFGAALLTVAMAIFLISATQAEQVIGSVMPGDKVMIDKLTALEEKMAALGERAARIEDTTAQTFKDLHRMWKELYQICKK